MNQTTRTVLMLVAAAAIAAGCSRMTSKPTKQVQVPDSGAPVLTSMELPPQSPAASQPAASPPGIISQASYARPLASAQSLKPFNQWTEQDAAEDALGRIGAAAVPALVTALRDPDPSVRLKAVEVLGRMGDDAQAAVPDLIRLLDDPDADVRKAATRTIGRIGPAAKAAVPALIQKLLESPPR